MIGRFDVVESMREEETLSTPRDGDFSRISLSRDEVDSNFPRSRPPVHGRVKIAVSWDFALHDAL